jgi:hypothetical protein
MKNLQSIFSGLMPSDLKSIRPKLTGGNPGHRFANQFFCPGHPLGKLVSTPSCYRCAQSGRLYICHRMLEKSRLISIKSE